jgi:hypothetical protein
MIKVYKMNGKTESHEVFQMGKTTFKVTFSKGNLDPKNRVPARFATGSKILQVVIESSPKYGKTIFLDKVYGDAAPAETPAPAATPAPKKGKAKGTETKGSELKVMEDVKTIADAASVLTAEGVLAAEIDGTVEGAIKVAKKYGISFPNLKGEE